MLLVSLNKQDPGQDDAVAGLLDKAGYKRVVKRGGPFEFNGVYVLGSVEKELTAAP